MFFISTWLRVGVFFSLPAGATVSGFLFSFNDDDSTDDRNGTDQYLYESFQQKRTSLLICFIVYVENLICAKKLQSQINLLPRHTPDCMLTWAESLRHQPFV